jgi:prophage DNA circulation protein
MAIRNVSKAPWRDDLMPAHFDRNMFHVETGSREGGRRIVLHEFPKKDLPYAEDLGRIAAQFSVRGYCITYPVETGIPLYGLDYRVARDALQKRLDMGGAGMLQLPTFEPMLCVCARYRLTEEEKFGGYCVFDMQFQEWGAPPFRETPSAQQELQQRSAELRDQVLRAITDANKLQRGGG